MKKLILGIAFSLVGCATAGSHVPGVKSVTLEFKGRDGESVDTRYYSNSRLYTYENGQLVRDRTEAVDFTVNSRVIHEDSTKHIVHFISRTTRKDGTAVDLHDLAFPELNEQIDYVIRGNGEVLQAGHYPPQSLYFVPSLPIPDHPVSVGDTWTMSHAWISGKDGVPLRLDVVAILKDIVSCEGDKVCGDVEISGHVMLMATPNAPDARFVSRMWGRMLFSTARGDVIWSDVRSHEEMGTPDELLKVDSCMLSETKMTATYKTQFACEPGAKPVEKVPQL